MSGIESNGVTKKHKKSKERGTKYIVESVFGDGELEDIMVAYILKKMQIDTVEKE